MVKRSLAFVSLEDALKVDWCSGGYAKRVRSRADSLRVSSWAMFGFLYS